MSRFFLLPVFLFFSLFTYSQTQNEPQSPYEINWAVDGPWLGVGIGLNVYGFHLIQNKEPLTEAQVSAMSREDIFIIDRWAAGNSSQPADELSYIPFYTSFALPLLLIMNTNERAHAGQLAVIFVESMATTGALFTITAGAVQKSRPLVYDQDLPLGDRIEKGAQRSFFAGHTAATAAATFFAAKAFADFNPDSWAKPYIWTAAAILPAWVGYLRIQGGKHFLTDNLIGYAVGAASGILIPELHKKKNENLDLSPTMGVDYQGISLRYRF